MGLEQLFLGLGQGLAAHQVQEEKREYDSYLNDKHLRSQILLQQMANVRPEDMGHYMEALQGVMGAKNQKTLDEAWGSITGKLVAENYQAEQQYGKDLLDYQKMKTGPEPEAMNIPGEGMQKPPLPPPPTPPWEGTKGKIRLMTPEGQAARQIDVYRAKSEFGTQQKMAVLSAQQEGRWRELQAKLQAQGVREMKLGTAEDGTATAIWRDPATGEVLTRKLDGVMTNSAYSADQRAQTAREKLEQQGRQFEQTMQDRRTRTEAWVRDLESKGEYRKALSEGAMGKPPSPGDLVKLFEASNQKLVGNLESVSKLYLEKSKIALTALTSSAREQAAAEALELGQRKAELEAQYDQEFNRFFNEQIGKFKQGGIVPGMGAKKGKTVTVEGKKSRESSESSTGRRKISSGRYGIDFSKP